jgi:DNA-binding NarL/FixJ family response regulator
MTSDNVPVPFSLTVPFSLKVFRLVLRVRKVVQSPAAIVNHPYLRVKVRLRKLSHKQRFVIGIVLDDENPGRESFHASSSNANNNFLLSLSPWGENPIEGNPGEDRVSLLTKRLSRYLERTLFHHAGGVTLKRITVLLIEDHIVVRQGLQLVMERDGDIKIIGAARTGREGVQMYEELRPDILVMDIAMPLLNGLQATRQILKAYPAAKILILSAHGDPEYIEQVVKAGALGYLIKHTSGEVVTKAIRALRDGQTFFSPAITKRLKADFQKARNGIGLRKKRRTKLTPREAELLQLIAEGQANKQIALELGISIKTVEKHRQSLMRKLSIHDVAGLTRFAIAGGFIESSIQSTIH